MSFLSSLFFILGYVSLVGPPRAIDIHARAQESGGELAGQPLLLVVAAEYVLRGGMFMVMTFGLREIISDGLFERYKIFLFLGALVASGALHTVIYYICFGRRKSKSKFKSKAQLARVYRLGRNLSYSVLPGFLSAGVCVMWQELNQIKLFSGDLVYYAFFGTWGAVAVLGLLEAYIVHRRPMGLDSHLT